MEIMVFRIASHHPSWRKDGKDVKDASVSQRGPALLFVVCRSIDGLNVLRPVSGKSA